MLLSRLTQTMDSFHLGPNKNKNSVSKTIVSMAAT